MRRLTYKDYRRYGHGRVVSFTLACPPWLWYGGCFAFGLFLAFVLP